MLERDRQREEIGSDYYHGGMVVERSAHLHPAKFFAGLYRQRLAAAGWCAPRRR